MVNSTEKDQKIDLTVLEAPFGGYQRLLLPLDVEDIYNNTTGSADLQLIARAKNNKDYAVKQIIDGNGMVPATELFCYELARELNIPTPHYCFIRMRDNSIAFGSEWEGGVRSVQNDNELIKMVMGKNPVRGIKKFFSSVYALDLFINNIDRHFGNYIFRNSENGLLALAFDFGRSWYEINPFGYECLDNNQNTKQCHDNLVKWKNYDSNIASHILDEIESINTSVIKDILKMIPDEWFPKKERKELLVWWGSDEMKKRITKLKAEL